jgi:beta-aspartyl-dipeptidase (metallo-type)
VFTLIRNGTVYDPAPRGQLDILIAFDRIAAIGQLDQAAVSVLDPECTLIDASGCSVVPGLIDPHAHLIGAGGEEGFQSRMPEIAADQLIAAGATTVVGCLGTDTIARHLPALFAKTQQLRAQGLTALMYTGGFWVPPPTLTGSVTSDLVLIDPVIGVGEIAIADTRSSEPSRAELAQLVTAAITGGMLAGKAGVTHFHVGPSPRRLAILRALMTDHDIPAKYVYPTHIGRSEALMDEAIAMAKGGSFVDVDTVEEDLARWLPYYLEHGGPPERLTVSSDAHTPAGSPKKWSAQIRGLLREQRLPVDAILACVTSNPAQALGLSRKGRLALGQDADVLVLDQDWEIRHVLAGGRHLLRDGAVCAESWPASS